MPSKHIDLTGKTFGRLFVKALIGPNKHGSMVWECQCSCGNIKTVDGQNLRGRTIVSCGCWKAENARKHLHGGLGPITHGKSNTREYKIWQMMIYRCCTLTAWEYPHYGGRGIQVCKRWRKSFIYFSEDMGTAPSSKHTLDRIDNDGDYEPSNCRWATRRQQANNRDGNIAIEFAGQTRTIAEWARKLGFTRSGLLYDRLNAGWSVQRTLTTPPRPIKPLIG